MIEKLIQEQYDIKMVENKAPIFQEHSGNGDNIGKGIIFTGDIVKGDKVIYSSPK